MAKWGKCDFKELERLNERLEQLSSVDFDTFAGKRPMRLPHGFWQR